MALKYRDIQGYQKNDNLLINFYMEGQLPKVYTRNSLCLNFGLHTVQL